MIILQLFFDQFLPAPFKICFIWWYIYINYHFPHNKYISFQSFLGCSSQQVYMYKFLVFIVKCSQNKNILILPACVQASCLPFPQNTDYNIKVKILLILNSNIYLPPFPKVLAATFKPLLKSTTQNFGPSDSHPYFVSRRIPPKGKVLSTKLTKEYT